MIAYSTIFRPMFWVVMGLIYALMVAGAPLWMEDLGFQMTWWKWVLAALWYALLSFSFAGGFTLLGEKEPAAWYKFIGFHLIITIILGVILWFLF
jgi:hypothetical protein